jgi:hypothetical protein
MWAGNHPKDTKKSVRLLILAKESGCSVSKRLMKVIHMEDHLNDKKVCKTEKTLTVRELIHLLLNSPMDAEVIIRDKDYNQLHEVSIYIRETGLAALFG